MKINLKIWLGVILASAAILFFRNYNFTGRKAFLFNRNMSNSLVVAPLTVDNMPQTGIHSLITNRLICNYDLKQDGNPQQLCKMTCYDPDTFSKTATFSFRMPVTAQVSFCNMDYVFYIDRLQLHAFNIQTGITRDITPPGCKVLDVVDTEGETSSVLFLGEEKTAAGYQTGFFVLNPGMPRVLHATYIEVNDSTKAVRNSLIYSGGFSKPAANTIAYICDKYSGIYFFDAAGIFQKKLVTKDGAPKPELITSRDAFYYKRGETFNVNSGLLKMGDTILVFSSRTATKDAITVDAYSFMTEKYLFSSVFNCRGKSSADILYAVSTGRHIVLGFEDGISLFNFSLPSLHIMQEGSASVSR